MFEGRTFFRSWIVFVLLAGCSYDFGGPTGDGGAAATASSGLTGTGAGPTGTGSVTGVTTGATTDATSVASTSGADQSSGSPAASTSTGVAPVPLAVCGFTDTFDAFNPSWFPISSPELQGGYLRVQPQQAGPFVLGGELSNNTYGIAECTLSTDDIQFDMQNPRAGVAVVDFDGSSYRWLALMWNGTSVTSESRNGFEVTAGPSMPVASLSRLTIHFTGPTARLYADTTFVGVMDAAEWAGTSHRVFVGALDQGVVRLGTFNAELNTNDVP